MILFEDQTATFRRVGVLTVEIAVTPAGQVGLAALRSDAAVQRARAATGSAA